MKRKDDSPNIETRPQQDRSSIVPFHEFNNQDGINDASNDDPCRVEAYRNEFDANGNDRREANDPWGEALFVKDASGNQEPRVDFDRQEGSHDESEIFKKVRNEHVENCGHVVLNDGGGRTDTFGDEDDPCQVGNEVGLGEDVKGEEPFTVPRVFVGLVCWHVEKHVPIPIHNVENNQWDLYSFPNMK